MTDNPPRRELVEQRQELEPHLAGMTQVVSEIARATCAHIELVGARPVFDQPLGARASQGDWIVLPLGRDPSAADGLPIPRRQLRRLWELHDAGLRFAAIAVAHELPSGTLGKRSGLPDAASGGDALLGAAPVDPPVGVLEQLRTPPPIRRAANLSRRLGTASTLVLKGYAAAVGAAASIAIAPLSLLDSTTSTSGPSSLPIVDPLIFGALTADMTAKPGTPAVWWLLASWDW